MFQNIVVAVDGSQHSMTAARLAAQIGQAVGGKVSALFIKDEALIHAPYWRDFGALTLPTTRFDHALDEFFQMRGEALLETLKEKYGMDGTIVTGRIDRELMRATRDADLLAMGSAGEAHEDNHDEEHVATRLMRTVHATSTPVLAAPAAAEPIARVRLAYCNLVSGNAAAGALDLSR
ncbi:MAG TPA: universal stress protein, partial [Deinococcales bacterium]|nr:universal stress protein [Deinococcales bacterium]